ncbi:MAG TPA: aldose 1-epimerase [Sphingomicrobium sp.]|jgi:aldose 1-epimerase|nr:aldose 1-epimerase [Sphingomicrobium sp.]
MTEAPPTLSTDMLELELSPSIGGAISNFIWTGEGSHTPILRESHTPLQKVLDASAFPLVPFVNRIRGGCFTFRGRQVRLAPNMAGDPSPLHGQGWTNPWRVESHSGSEAVLVFEHAAGEWPWSYEARQHFRLAANALEFTLTCRNTSDEPMPCGLGLHPYFPCSERTRIQTQVRDVWTVDDDVLPVSRMPASGRYAIGDDPACGRGLDNGYSDWSGRALFTDPGWPFEIELSSQQARFFQLYSPEQGGIFVAEPVTHANAALNEPEEDWAALGIQLLTPGGEMRLDARIAVQVKQAALG